MQGTPKVSAQNRRRSRIGRSRRVIGCNRLQLHSDTAKQYCPSSSSVGRAALEELAPGCVAFLPLQLKVPARMRTADAYFFPDVLPRAQLIDWDRSSHRSTPRACIGWSGKPFHQRFDDRSLDKVQGGDAGDAADLARGRSGSSRHPFLREQEGYLPAGRFVGSVEHAISRPARG
jgi:hypothetical protein